MALSMGALDDGHFNGELENRVKLGRIELDVEEEGQTQGVAIEDAVKVLLQGLGEDINREGLKRTPFRVSKAFREGTRGYKQRVNEIVQDALFPEAGFDTGVGHAGGAGGLVIVRDLDLFSYCESCLLPFQFKCHVGYVASGHRVLGLSKVSRVADVFAKRLQDPQRLADEVCSALHQGIKPAGVAIVLQCSHIHFPRLEPSFLESDHHGWVKVLVSSGCGVFENKSADVWNDFLSLLKFRGVPVERAHTGEFPDKFWCPSRCSSTAKLSSVKGSAIPGMVNAVASILRSLGENPSRNELLGTPACFVKWLMSFKRYNLEMKLNGSINGIINPFKSNGDVNHSKRHMQSELNLLCWSLCEHHLLPFHGVVHIGFFSAEEVSTVRKSILQSIVHFHGFKLQVQERLTRQIAESVSYLFGADIMVVVEAYHTCMVSRGIEKLSSSTATIAVLGRFSTDASARTVFLQKIPNTAKAEL